MVAAKAFPCPSCGREVPAKAEACPHCGARGNPKWNEDHGVYEGLDLSDAHLAYGKFTEGEFGQLQRMRRKLSFGQITAGVLFFVVVILILCNKFFWP